MIISVLLPTRKRTHLVETSVRSLLANAIEPHNVEIMIAYDGDDEESKQYFGSTQWQDFINFFGARQQTHETQTWGYQELHRYYNFLASHCHGDWLLIWNDDALMRSSGWDGHIKDNQDFVGLLHMTTENYRSKFALFPLIPRAWIELFGSVGEIPVDSWIHHICMEAQAVKKIEPVIFHDRYDMSGQNYDETYLKRDTTSIKRNYKSEESRQLRHQWACKLMDYIAGLNQPNDTA